MVIMALLVVDGCHLTEAAGHHRRVTIEGMEEAWIEVVVALKGEQIAVDKEVVEHKEDRTDLVHIDHCHFFFPITF